jgi:hypothetical protein
VPLRLAIRLVGPLKDLRLTTTGADGWTEDWVQEGTRLIMLIKLQVECSIPLLPIIQRPGEAVEGFLHFSHNREIDVHEVQLTTWHPVIEENEGFLRN